LLQASHGAEAVKDALVDTGDRLKEAAVETAAVLTAARLLWFDVAVAAGIPWCRGFEGCTG
jgi:hypothetical protein